MEILFICVMFVSLVSCQNLTFTNTIIGGYSGNPCVLRVGDYYYLTLQNYGYTQLVIYKSPILTNFENAQNVVALTAPVGFSGLSPDEMVEINGGLYLYFHMGGQNQNGRRLYVIKANNPADPMAGWSEPIRLLPDWDYEAIDGAVLKHNGLLYFVWRMSYQQLGLYISPMISPTWIGSPIVLLKEPKQSWECNGGCFVESATFVYSQNVSYLIYSASSWGSPDFCLGQMSIAVGTDPLVPENWQAVDEPVFWRNDDDDVYSTGAAEFTTSPDGRETWMIYHAAVNPNRVGRHQTARLEKIEWNDDGSPKFPRPMGTHRSKPVPSGQTSTCF